MNARISHSNTALHLALALLLAQFVALQAADAPKQKPSIIFIVGDDCGYNEFSYLGGKTPTPRIDSLAKGGVTLTNGYVTSAVCSPSRAGLLTGRYQQRFGFLGNLPFKKLEIMGVPLDEKMLPVALKPAGYRSIAIGKWHLGWDPKFRPLERGFDDFYGFLNGARSYFPDKNPPFQTALMLDRKIAGPEKFTYLTDEFGDRAVDYINRYKDQPFFLYLAFNATHSPKDALPEDLAKVGPGKKVATQIAAMTIALDRNVGKVLDVLDRHHLADNTLVVFLSDNGGQEQHDNRPLRGFKHDVYEGGVRVPFLMRWPRGLPAAVKYDKPVISLDLYATVLAMAGIPMPTEKTLDGVNLIPFLTRKDPGRPHGALYFTFGSGWAIRDGDTKLVFNRDRKGPPELFDLESDVPEKKDLASTKLDTTARLKSLFDQWNRQNKPSIWGDIKASAKDE